ncbi:MAG TPA: carbon storage regulator [Clostridiaceae bacterium]|nr:carbon storage regulator [Clostridiaceae bacterium]
MLVITRKSNQSLIINGNVEIVILEAKDGSVKVGINAPKNIKIYRKEIFDEIKDENKNALNADKTKIGELMKK